MASASGGGQHDLTATYSDCGAEFELLDPRDSVLHRHDTPDCPNALCPACIGAELAKRTDLRGGPVYCREHREQVSMTKEVPHEVA